MCGRFALVASEADIVSHFELKSGFSMRPRYNISPGETIPAVTALGKMDFFQWGFIPGWRKAEAGVVPQRFINAHMEGVSEKPTFRRAFKTQRCLIPVTGYFEWKLMHQKKQPYYIFSNGTAILAFAGIWDVWISAEGLKIETIAILTQPANEVLMSIHDRMPVMITKENYGLWLNVKTKMEVLVQLLQAPSQQLVFYAVATAVNNPRFDQSACIISL